MKNFTIPTILTFVLAVAGCDFMAGKSNASESRTNSDAAMKNENYAVPNAAPTPKPVNAANKNDANRKNAPAAEELPHKVDDQTAVSPVYGINSVNCRHRDDEGSEGDEFVRQCKGYGKYSLWASGFDDQITYRIEADDTKTDFVTYLAPLEGGDADEYRRADRYAQKLAGRLEWILDEQGVPYAVFVHAYFYKNTGAKPAANPKNKVAEFVLLRGLNGFGEIDSDIQTAETAYNPDEWARKTAYEVWEKKRK